MAVRDQLVRWWPLVDLAKLDVGDGDVLVVRVIGQFMQAEGFAHLQQDIAAAFPGQPVIYVSERDDFAVRPRVEMRAEDLVQPKRHTTME